jgi:hypothetical protein
VNPIAYRNEQARKLPAETGVYVLCDLDETPIYVGQSVDGIRARVRRHLTSARSDVIANRQLDVWEIAFVWAWPVAAKRKIDNTEKKKITIEEGHQIQRIESYLYHKFDAKSRLVNGTIVPELSKREAQSLNLSRPIKVQVMSDAEIELRKEPARRLPRQAEQFRSLLDHMLNVKNEQELRRALEAHFVRLEKYYRGFLRATQNVDTAAGEAEDRE